MRFSGGRWVEIWKLTNRQSGAWTKQSLVTWSVWESLTKSFWTCSLTSSSVCSRWALSFSSRTWLSNALYGRNTQDKWKTGTKGFIFHQFHSEYSVCSITNKCFSPTCHELDVTAAQTFAVASSLSCCSRLIFTAWRLSSVSVFSAKQLCSCKNKHDDIRGSGGHTGPITALLHI